MNPQPSNNNASSVDVFHDNRCCKVDNHLIGSVRESSSSIIGREQRHIEDKKYPSCQQSRATDDAKHDKNRDHTAKKEGDEDSTVTRSTVQDLSSGEIKDNRDDMDDSGMVDIELGIDCSKDYARGESTVSTTTSSSSSSSCCSSSNDLSLKNDAKGKQQEDEDDDYSDQRAWLYGFYILIVILMLLMFLFVHFGFGGQAVFLQLLRGGNNDDDSNHQEQQERDNFES